MASVRRSASLTSLASAPADPPMSIRRPASNPELGRRDVRAPAGGVGERRATRLLVNVTVERSLGPVQIVMETERSVGDLVRAAVEAYMREGRRPLLASRSHLDYELHYSQFSLECLNPEEKLINLGSRNFFLCSRRASTAPALDCRRDEGWSFPLRRFISSLSK